MREREKWREEGEREREWRWERERESGSMIASCVAYIHRELTVCCSSYPVFVDQSWFKCLVPQRPLHIQQKRGESERGREREREGEMEGRRGEGERVEVRA